MQTLLEVLEKSADFLNKKGIEKSRLDAELLMAHELKCKRLDLYLRYDQPLEKDFLDRLRKQVMRRGNREPLQYITGETEFYDMILKTDSRALVPRPETEELIELIVQRLDTAPEKILDFGTGSGAIALALAGKFPTATITAVDKSADALALAKENAEQLQVSNVDFKCADWIDFEGENFDLLVSNPPYLTEDEWVSAEPEVKDYEPKTALVAGKAGLSDLLNILTKAKTLLKSGALIGFETGIDQHDQLLKSAKEQGYLNSESKKDLNDYDRYFFTNTP